MCVCVCVSSCIPALGGMAYVCVCMCVCVRVCVRACVRACVCVCVKHMTVSVYRVLIKLKLTGLFSAS